MKRMRIMTIYLVVLVGMFTLGLWLNDMKQDQVDRLVVSTRAEITVYTDGDPTLMALIGEAYEKEAQVRVHIIPIPAKQMGTRLALPEGEQQLFPPPRT